MDLLLRALVMGIVEGLTEFLPISSTGHLIIVGNILQFLPKEQRGLFEIFIQLGAILAVCWEYRQKLRSVAVGLFSKAPARRFAGNVAIAFVPAGVLALVLGDTIKAHLFAPVPVAVAFVAGGLMIFWAERRRHVVSVADVDAMTWQDALKVGFAQCFALIPGTSRSGATIIGGLFCGLSRKAATEFSFFLAIPTLSAAALYDLFKHRALLDIDLAGLLVVGFAASFVCALFAVRALLRYVTRHDFIAFAWYRIAFGAVVLLTAYLGVVDWTD